MVPGMQAPDSRDVGVLLMRAWLEVGHPKHLRVRITRVIGLAEPETLAVTTVEDVFVVVRVWLEELLRRK